MSPLATHAELRAQPKAYTATLQDISRPSVAGSVKLVLCDHRFSLADGFGLWLDADQLLVAKFLPDDSRHHVSWYVYSVVRGSAKPLDGLNDTLARLHYAPPITDGGALVPSTLLVAVPNLPCVLYRDLPQNRWCLIGLSGRIRQSWAGCHVEGEILWTPNGRNAMLGAHVLDFGPHMEDIRHASWQSPPPTDPDWAAELYLNNKKVSYSTIDPAGLLANFWHSGMDGAAILTSHFMIVPGVSRELGNYTGEFYKCRVDRTKIVTDRWLFPLPKISITQADVSSLDGTVAVCTRESSTRGVIQRIWASRFGTSRATLVATISDDADVHGLKWIPGTSSVSFVVGNTLYSARINIAHTPGRP
jgi:hypothetical protein